MMPMGASPLSGATDNARSRLESMGTEAGLRPKGDVAYRPAEDARATCGGCKHYASDPGALAGTCELVAGRIEPQMVCDLFEPPQGPDQMQQAGPAEAAPMSY